MPAKKLVKKKSTSRGKTKRSSTKIPQASLTKAYESEISYETQVIIVVLLLLFVYPLGLIFMWLWMKSWPLWLKLLITLPFALGALMIFGIVLLFGALLSNGALRARHEQRMQQYLSPTPITTTVSPADSSSVTY